MKTWHKTEGLSRPCTSGDLFSVREGTQCSNCLAVWRRDETTTTIGAKTMSGKATKNISTGAVASLNEYRGKGVAKKVAPEPPQESLRDLRRPSGFPSIEEFLTCTEKDILDYAQSVATDYVTDGDNYILLKSANPNPLMLVAHIDTVRLRNPKTVRFERGVYRSADGDALGADDRAGVYAVLKARMKCIQLGIQVPHVLLTNYEESGGRGVRQAIDDKIFDLDPVRLLVEVDRAGAEEAVTYSGELPDSAAKYVSSFGWSLGSGSFTDIATMIEEFSIPGVNLSCGYYRQHTEQEFLVAEQLETTIRVMLAMLSDPFTEMVEQQQYARRNGRDGYRDWIYTGAYQPERSVKTYKLDARGFPMDDDDYLAEEYGYSAEFALDCIMDDSGLKMHGVCDRCDTEWEDCSCGHVAAVAERYIDDDLLEFLIKQDGYVGMIEEDSAFHRALLERYELYERSQELDKKKGGGVKG